MICICPGDSLGRCPSWLFQLGQIQGVGAHGWLLAHLQPLHKDLVPFEVAWGLIWPLDTKGCIFPTCPSHIFCLSKEYLLPVGILKEAVCLGGQRGKGQALALAVLQLGDCR